MKHPFIYEDIEVAAKRLGVEFDAVRRAAEELWRSAVVRGAVVITRYYKGTDDVYEEPTGSYDAAIIKLPEDKP